MADPVALQIIKALETRLNAISVAGGYNNDVNVLRGTADVNPDQIEALPVINLYDAGDEPSEDGTLCNQTVIQQEIIIEGRKLYNAEVPGDAAAYLWQDIMRATFLDDSTLGGLCLYIARGPRDYTYPPSGGNLIAVRQTVNVIYQETYGNP